MSRDNRRAVRFVRLLLAGGTATCGEDGLFRTPAGARIATLPRTDVVALIGDGVLTGGPAACRASAAASTWVRRHLAGADPFAAQHRQEVRTGDGRLINLAESPLARLAVPAPGETEAFLSPHQVEAGERFRRLFERAQLRPRTTMSYDPARVGGGRQAGAPEIGDMAADARRTLARLVGRLPRDCADVVIDVCGLEKGLQVIETERGWPRRSAKLVLRIALDQLAAHFGLDAAAVGRDSGRRSWMEPGGRPPMFIEG